MAACTSAPTRSGSTTARRSTTAPTTRAARRSTRRRSRYLPSLAADDIAPGQVGYRPKLQSPGGPIADFLIWRDGAYVHLGGIESPGMTASMAIARRVAALV